MSISTTEALRILEEAVTEVDKMPPDKVSKAVLGVIAVVAAMGRLGYVIRKPSEVS